MPCDFWVHYQSCKQLSIYFWQLTICDGLDSSRKKLESGILFFIKIPWRSTGTPMCHGVQISQMAGEITG